LIFGRYRIFLYIIVTANSDTMAI